MKKVKNKKLRTDTILLISGTLIILTTPLINELFQAYIARDCPVMHGVRECGLGKGLANADHTIEFTALWLLAGGILVVAGAVIYFKTKKRA